MDVSSDIRFPHRFNTKKHFDECIDTHENADH